jgi:cytidylate kinase
MSNTSTYILSWDCYGLESCINATELEQQRVMNILGDKDQSRDENINQIVNIMTLRARFNSQRRYEIYAIDVDENICHDDIVQSFKHNPQGAAELVRSLGRKIYSDREDPSSIKIR